MAQEKKEKCSDSTDHLVNNTISPSPADRGRLEGPCEQIQECLEGFSAGPSEGPTGGPIGEGRL